MAARSEYGTFAHAGNIAELMQTTVTRPAPVVHPHLWLERCPTINELLMARRLLARDHRLPRDGEKLVCSIPWDEDTDVALLTLLDGLRGRGMWFPADKPLEFPEVARIMDWSIVGRRT
jgi:hypothetical protein